MLMSWVSRIVEAEIVSEATAAYPYETGGVLLGYWAEDNTQVVIVNCVGPGPDATHKRRNFIPDYVYHEDEIAKLYRASGTRYTYLGDWHTHPDEHCSRLSWLDKSTLLRIANFVPARTNRPIMAVLIGSPEQWNLTMWMAEPRKWGPFQMGICTDRMRVRSC